MVKVKAEISIDESIDAALIDHDLITRTVVAVLEHEQVTGRLEVDVLITTEEEIHRLNREYRNVDSPTDVLSFAHSEGSGSFVLPPNTPRYLGDIALSFDRVRAQAEAYGHSLQRELAYLVAHGTLHLLGYDHERSLADETDMRQREEAVMTAIGLPR